MIKACTKCLVEKPQESFYKRTNRKSGYSSLCKTCCNEAARLSRVKRRIVDPEFVKKERLNSQFWVENNKERHKELTKRWRKEHSKDPEFLASARTSTAKYKAKKLQATPPWLSEDQQKHIERIYFACAKVSTKTGKPHDVDHIVPLQGENVCGLHVPWNLAILPAGINRSKGNAFDNWAFCTTEP